MKHNIGIRTVILLWLLLSVTSSLQSQSAGDIDTLSEWRVDFIWHDAYSSTYEYGRYYISGDTVIDSKEYYKVYHSGYWYDDYGSPPYEYHYFNHLLSGIIREEDDKWYWMLGFTEKLFYDFTMEVGDTVNSCANGMNDIITVDSIDTILVDGDWKKRFHLHLHCTWCGGAEYIIEDIGATTGLFNHLTYYTTFSELVCFAKNGESQWGASTEDCNLAVDIEELYNTVRVSAYPNPFTTSSTISFTLDGKSKVQISIFNSLGEEVYRIEEQNMPPGNHSITPSLQHLPQGMYFAVLRSDEGVSVVKMVKQ